jgi:hypothetical protein
VNKGSPAKQKYDREYAARPEQKKKRAQRNAARREYEKAHGDLPGDVDVDHKRRIAKGGTNTTSNLRAVPEKKNAGWRKGKKNYG